MVDFDALLGEETILHLGGEARARGDDGEVGIGIFDVHQTACNGCKAEQGIVSGKEREKLPRLSYLRPTAEATYLLLPFLHLRAGPSCP